MNTMEFAQDRAEMTSGNGKEFAGHESIAQRLKMSVYFAHPYHFWERGLNENTNGLLRQYFPKGSSFEKVTEIQVQSAVNNLNHRPRKILGFKTPFEVFFCKKHALQFITTESCTSKLNPPPKNKEPSYFWHC